MAKTKPKPLKLPPPTVRECWGAFLKWGLGVPLVCAGGLGVIAFGLWVAGGQELMWQTTAAMGTAFFWIAGIMLMYPFLMVMWVAELRAGLKAAREWEALSPEAQQAAITEAREARAVLSAKRKTRRAQKAKE